jgi:hypothetical protein
VCNGDGIRPCFKPDQFRILSEFFVKMIGTKDFRNPKNLSQDWIGGSIQNQK